MGSKIKILLQLLLVLILLSSCVIEINENGYSSLTDASKKHIRPFSMELLNHTQSYKDSIFIYEISSRDIKQIIKRNKYTWIHFWAPYCSAKSCINVTSIMDEVKEKEKDKGFIDLLVATSFDLEAIQSRLKTSNFTQPVFILSDSLYGHKQGKAMRVFATEIDNNSLLKKNQRFGDYLFCDTLLKIASWNLTPQQIDSVINYR